jgi:hypothetical protein
MKNPVSRIAAMAVLALVSVSGAGAQAPAPGGAAGQPQASPPRVVGTIPPFWAEKVDPNLREVVIQFDQPMTQGRSLTGGGATFPKIAVGGQLNWRDPQTFVVPVALEPGHAYWMGINSPSHRNFRSEAGLSVIPLEFCFTTAGTTTPANFESFPPKVVSLTPANGAKGVSPSITELRVTFDREMAGGFSWTGSGPNYPEGQGAARWLPDKKTCVKPVTLKPNWKYQFGLNAPSFRDFRSAKGMPLRPTPVTFTTGAK